jgi:hypothetical protein
MTVFVEVHALSLPRYGSASRHRAGRSTFGVLLLVVTGLAILGNGLRPKLNGSASQSLVH